MNIYTIELNLNIYTLYFAVTKVTAPQGSTISRATKNASNYAITTRKEETTNSIRDE